MRGERRATLGREKIPIEQRFWSKVVRRSDGDCWLWSGATDGHGYGYLAGTRGANAIKAHRYSYELHKGPIGDADMCVCHRCDTPACVNPEHLFLGTRADNNADKMRKGRDYDKSGEMNPNAKLDYLSAAEIRHLRESGWTQQAIADKYGVSQNAISRIVRGIHWKEV